MTRTDWLADERGAAAAERILDAAGTLFAERGVAHVGMTDVARASGCSRATLYRYFDGRDALRAAFVDRQARRIGRVVSSELGGLRDPVERLARAVAVALREVRADGALAPWFGDEGAGISGSLAASSEVVAALAASVLTASPEVEHEVEDAERARWLVRCIVSLLTVPGADAAAEARIIERFVVPSVLGGAPDLSPAAAADRGG